jgi:hypothetical protein
MLYASREFVAACAEAHRATLAAVEFLDSGLVELEQADRYVPS